MTGPRPRAVFALLCLLGALASTAVVGLGTVGLSRPERQVLGSWLPTATAPWRALHLHVSPHRATVAAVLLLVLLWVAGAVLVRRYDPGRRTVLAGAGVVALPFVLAPPFLSRDAYAYVAQGRLLQHGLDPYRSPVADLGLGSAAVRAVDPIWRHTVPPYGPVALRLEQALVWLGGSERGALVVLRALVLLCVVGSVALLRRAVPAEHRSLVTWLACSPLVLLQLVAAAHLDAVVCLLVVAAVGAATADRPLLAAALATTATATKVTAAVVLLLVLVRAGRAHVRRALLAAAATAGGCALLLPGDPLGWVPALRTPGSTWVPGTPSSTLYLGLLDLSHRLGVPLGPQALAACRLLVLAVGVGCLVLLVRRAVRQRFRRVDELAGLALLVLLACGPVLWPW
ncbi:MAG: polyprenol phosphomannose-dependent alpha 1,6 mannosyltransferase MptB, partial [Mycobacteriales bacterium]